MRSSNHWVTYACMHPKTFDQFWGMVNSAGRFVTDYAEITTPLILLTGKDDVLEKLLNPFRTENYTPH